MCLCSSFDTRTCGLYDSGTMKKLYISLFVSLVFSVSCSGADHVPAATVAGAVDAPWNDMTATERRHFDRFVNREVSPCGKVTLAQAAMNPDSCPVVSFAVRYVAFRTMEGDTQEELEAAYLRRYGRGYLSEIDVSGSPVLGNTEAAVRIVVFSDFNCPFCAKTARMLKEMQQKYNPHVSVTFKFFPLDSHQDSRPMANAAAAAALQGCFWNFHDLLFENRLEYSTNLMKDIAMEAGCDPDKLVEDMEGLKVRAQVTADKDQAEKLRLRGTPSLFVNSRYLEEGFRGLDVRIREELVRLGIEWNPQS